MNYRKLDLETLRLARGIIKRDDHHYICHALRDCRDGLKNRRPTHEEECSQTRLINFVMDLLDGSPSYNSWIRVEHPEVMKYDEADDIRAKKGRLAWMDWIEKKIREFPYNLNDRSWQYPGCRIMY